MAAANSGKPTPARALGATQTIDEIEARAAEIAEAERAAVLTIAECLRELAVTLPAESVLPVRFAKTAKRIVSQSPSESGSSLAAYDVDWLMRECAQDAELAAVVATIRAVESFPAGSSAGRALVPLVGQLCDRFGLDS